MCLQIRQFGPVDIDFALACTTREGWGADPWFFRTIVECESQGSFIAEVDGQPVGMVTTAQFNSSSWIGNLIVEPRFRGQGLGARLLDHAMAHLRSRGAVCVRLEADPPGISLYRRVGFVDEFESLRFRFDGELPPKSAKVVAVPLQSRYLEHVATLDQSAFGCGRLCFLHAMWPHLRGAWWLPDGQTTRGFIMVTPRSNGCRIGPWVAVDAESASLLLQSALDGVVDRPVVLGVPAANRAAVELLQRLAFEPTASSFRMRFGPDECAISDSQLFAIANGAVG